MPFVIVALTLFSSMGAAKADGTVEAATNAGPSSRAMVSDSTQVDAGRASGQFKLLVQSVQAEPVDSLAVEAEPVDSYFLDDRAITRIPTKAGLGVLTAVGTGFLAIIVAQPFIGEEPEEVLWPEEAGYFFVGLVVGYPLGVYLADPVESSFWMTYVGGYGLALGSVILGVKMGGTTAKASLVVAMGSPIMASELSRLLPKRYRNPNPFKWLFGKFRRPSPRVSFGLVPDLQRGLSARATLRF